MRIVSWNLNKATTGRIKSWEYLCDLNPDIALLQEVNSIPDLVKDRFEHSYQKATNKNETSQKFGTAILVKGKITNSIELSSRSNWINDRLKRYTGLFIASEIILDNGFHANVVSVHSPAWFFDSSDFDEIEFNEIKLRNSKKIWGTELLWSALKNLDSQSGLPWIVGGDFNSSTTFDFPKNRGNQEVLDRMNLLALTECLFHSKRTVTPTFKNSGDKKIIHQIDHLFISSAIIENLKNCEAGKPEDVFDNKLSDHLPIIADLEIQ